MVLTSFSKVGPHLKQVTANLGVHSGEFDDNDDDGGGDDGDRYDGDADGDGVDRHDGGDGLSILNLSLSWCEANIIKNSLVPIWPAAQFLFVITSLHTAIAPPKVVELIRMANAIFGIVTSNGLGIAVGALFK